ncbi:hypothetical protein VTJ04DRAFT_9934 [Mycothermus thermophilus]|uniref:uncharacterized protein n=1 Tax=Humicola insolens TaxID=85995 RepID=UPI003742A553
MSVDPTNDEHRPEGSPGEAIAMVMIPDPPAGEVLANGSEKETQHPQTTRVFLEPSQATTGLCNTALISVHWLGAQTHVVSPPGRVEENGLISRSGSERRVEHTGAESAPEPRVGVPPTPQQ